MNEYSIDEIDLRLLDALQTDAGRHNHELAAHCGVSPATSLRRIRRLEALGLIERRVALLQPERLARAVGHGLTALVEVSLDRQGAAQLDAFEARAVAEPAVQQCYRVSPGPDFMLVLVVPDMPGYLAVAQRLFTDDANVRNVKAFFSLKRAKFTPAHPLPTASPQK
ncbi:Lrp/AsnC family transcriptional regulator [Tepidicella baoligensis]|uniref:Lrp/AsnC family transcriptional regulator n=1 Tax=Tepidicella baoligensis TaxID=2707016 RepID=UPI0015DAFEE2|nr:Lrp/AsnC family transcriptional regulator [Tepidicella baoligensis]